MFRVLQVLPSLNIGGVERATVDIARGLKKTFPTHPTYVASSGGDLQSHLEANDIEHITLPSLGEKTPQAIIRNVFQLVSIIRKHKIQIIHVRSRAPAWSAYLASKITRKPLVTTYHGLYSGSHWPKILYNSVMAKGDRVIAISRFLYQHLQSTYSLSHPRLQLVYEGIDTDFFSPNHVTDKDRIAFREANGILPHDYLILLPGRFVKHKGHHVVLNALSLMDNASIHVIFLAENGALTYQNSLHAMSEALGVTKQVHFITQATPMNLAYAAADVVVMPSLKPETFGRVIAEAGAMERLILASDLGAAPELCQDKKTGFLIQPNNAQDLAQALSLLYNLPQDKRHIMEKEARSHIVKNFSLHRMITETLEVYKGLV